MSRSLALTLLSIALTLLPAAHRAARAQNLLLDDQKLLATGGTPGDHFGDDCALAENLAAVAAPDAAYGRKLDAGAVELFRLDAGDQWIHETTLYEPTPKAGNHFGRSIALSGSRLLVSSLSDSTQAGSAYIYTRGSGSWQLDQTLFFEVFGGYGSSVDLVGDLAAVGGYISGTAGEAAIFRRVSSGGWALEDIVAPPDGANSDWFGQDLCIDDRSWRGEALLVGSKRHDQSRGAAYLFRHDGNGQWDFEHKFGASDGVDGDQFGTAVAMVGERVAVSTPYRDDQLQNSGAVYVYRWGRSGWKQEKLLPSQVEVNGYFGCSLAMDDDALVVGACGLSGGAAFLFRECRGESVEQHRLKASTATGRMGHSCAIDEDRILLGAPFDDQQGNDAGAAFAYEVSPFALATPPWSVGTGDTLRFLSSGGQDGTQGFLVVSSIDGAPYFSILFRQPFDSVGTWKLSATVPPVPGLAGTTLGFQILSPWPGQGIAQTNESFVQFQ